MLRQIKIKPSLLRLSDLDYQLNPKVDVLQ